MGCILKEVLALKTTLSKSLSDVLAAQDKCRMRGIQKKQENMGTRKDR